MKVKKSLYCITDKYNKPDFRFLFDDPKRAQEKIKQLKSGVLGETIFLSKFKRDFFVDGVNKNYVSQTKRIAIKKGCWTALEVRKVNFIDEISPTKHFEKMDCSPEFQLNYSKKYVRDLPFLNTSFKSPLECELDPRETPVSFWGFDWQMSFLRTKSFATALVLTILVTSVATFTVGYQKNNTTTEELADLHLKQAETTVQAQTKVLGAKDEKIAQQFDQKLDAFVLDALKRFDTIKTEELEGEIYEILKGNPMEEMAPLIAKKDRTVAAFLVGIAMKESGFGRHVPVLNGKNCYNYWGYRGIRKKMGTGGHTCFDGPQDAIDTVGGRLERLVKIDVDTPQEMVLWKCGSACSKDPNAGRWINDVTINFSKLMNEKT
ncbi:glucosaminidase domain-containing protein [bacterium]|jgi:hypothetical protein|nr:glucosaminidase domain-containing protein [bacterium]MBT4251604.1 glucosaminidase domain-containing protein [bacterium]MBT4597653.1 glucosaminidase domain-containing protein [bacterium]MBT6753666.1 glucosaminidase domain-containing protein [bacterium]MBT7037803.1 glucosaminidase domain-containing protein [bacterium]